MTSHTNGDKPRFLVVHDYGMGQVAWWIRARSAREIVETFAECEVLDTPEALEAAAGWALEEVDIDAPTMPPGLDGMRAERDGQRDLPGFGALAGRGIVYVVQPWDGDEDFEPSDYLVELDSDGRRLRQIEVREDGDAVRTDIDDWLFNPPFDLYDPELAECEIDKDEFERAWQAARPAPRDPSDFEI
ncbi:hypothetical protein AB0N05_04910 [Nocardia sp. NPDC051030]|uniref:hypothetical protein n=1 Tax=Nocardia sp. NPDC051030 TaxID=3155162 RepID=UPI00341ACF87